MEKQNPSPSEPLPTIHHWNHLHGRGTSTHHHTIHNATSLAAPGAAVAASVAGGWKEHPWCFTHSQWNVQCWYAETGSFCNQQCTGHSQWQYNTMVSILFWAILWIGSGWPRGESRHHKMSPGRMKVMCEMYIPRIHSQPKTLGKPHSVGSESSLLNQIPMVHHPYLGWISVPPNSSAVDSDAPGGMERDDLEYAWSMGTLH